MPSERNARDSQPSRTTPAQEARRLRCPRPHNALVNLPMAVTSDLGRRPEQYVGHGNSCATPATVEPARAAREEDRPGQDDREGCACAVGPCLCDPLAF
ncbi:hypothetical protein AAFF_G00171840 [Aldrovandia affinis]|uniref:Uncharacterized protein n=1 Tax=Aldrovandia affinis TaxID=143900 RepID=A0AAD7WW53_9TELE|nr:hypothetical protein AAFF_G00171840 [Aldrovandia affinis]